MKRWSEAESFTIFENHVLICTAIRKVSYFAINLVNFLAPKLIQHVIAIGSIKFFVGFSIEKIVPT